jgi:hypothetical protein
MTTTRTSSLPTATLAALRDELEKIAAEKPKKSTRLRRVLKAIGLHAVGYGLGHGAGMFAEHSIKKHLGPRWKMLNSVAKRRILGPALGLATGASVLAAHQLKKRVKEADE